MGTLAGNGDPGRLDVGMGFVGSPVKPHLDVQASRDESVAVVAEGFGRCGPELEQGQIGGPQDQRRDSIFEHVDGVKLVVPLGYEVQLKAVCNPLAGKIWGRVHARVQAMRQRRHL